MHDALVDDIRRQIQDGVLQAGSYVLPERELARKYKVSSRAVREGLARLEAEGLICRQQGRGTIVQRRETKTETSKLKNVVVIFQGPVRDTSTAEYFDGLQQAFQREGYGTTLYVTEGLPEKETRIVEQLAAAGVPGLVLFSSHPATSFAHLQAAQQAGTKIVLFDHDFPGFQTNFVGIDDRAGGYEAAGHLIRLGCQELLFINSEQDWTTHTLRQQGFEMAAAKLGNGIPARVLTLPAFKNSAAFRADLRRELPPLLKLMQRRLGVVAWNDPAALQAIDCLRDEGWSVPTDAAVVGFANELEGAIAGIPLTTMDSPREEIAQQAAHLMVDQLREPNREPQQIRLKSRLIIRESCGAYPSPARRVHPSVVVA